jgi:hypothetical protein
VCWRSLTAVLKRLRCSFLATGGCTLSGLGVKCVSDKRVDHVCKRTVANEAASWVQKQYLAAITKAEITWSTADEFVDQLASYGACRARGDT